MNNYKQRQLHSVAQRCQLVTGAVIIHPRLLNSYNNNYDINISFIEFFGLSLSRGSSLISQIHRKEWILLEIQLNRP
jgi:hypothetical protein